MLIQQWNPFRECSASNEIRSTYAQCAMKFLPRMLSMYVHVKTVHILPLAEHARKFVPRMLSVWWNCFLICSVSSKITQKYQITMQILTIKTEILKNRLGTHFFDSSSKIFGSVYARSRRKCSNIEILAKIEGKENWPWGTPSCRKGTRKKDRSYYTYIADLAGAQEIEKKKGTQMYRTVLKCQGNTMACL